MNNYNRMSYDEYFESLGFNNISELNNNIKTNNDLYNCYEGYVKGNLFKEEYIPYKQYKPINLNPNSDKEELLYNLNQKHFAMHDANLYLDVYPNDKDMMDNYKRYRDEYNKLLNEYQSKYGSLFVNDSNLNSIPFLWAEESFPWERGDR